jgi:thiosulfate dehydrogenase [quinone] large subunit
MNKYAKVFLVLLRLALGWMFLYSGLTKIMDPSWSAAGLLTHASTFSGFYNWLASPGLIGFTNFVNEWGQLLLGISLILGLFVRLSSVLGAALMILYYLPILKFPYPNEHSFIVDEHIIYALALLVLATVSAGKIFGLASWCSKLPWCARHPRLQRVLD